MRGCVLDTQETQNFEIVGHFSDCSDSMCARENCRTGSSDATKISQEIFRVDIGVHAGETQNSEIYFSVAPTVFGAR